LSSTRTRRRHLCVFQLTAGSDVTYPRFDTAITAADTSRYTTWSPLTVQVDYPVSAYSRNAAAGRSGRYVALRCIVPARAAIGADIDFASIVRRCIACACACGMSVDLTRRRGAVAWHRRDASSMRSLMFPRSDGLSLGRRLLLAAAARSADMSSRRRCDGYAPADRGRRCAALRAYRPFLPSAAMCLAGCGAAMSGRTPPRAVAVVRPEIGQVARPSTDTSSPYVRPSGTNDRRRSLSDVEWAVMSQ
jgi:hypothetical protein